MFENNFYMYVCTYMQMIDDHHDFCSHHFATIFAHLLQRRRALSGAAAIRAYSRNVFRINRTLDTVAWRASP